MRKVLVRNAVQTLTTDVIVEKTKLNESTSTHFHPIEIRCLSDIIARQKSSFISNRQNVNLIVVFVYVSITCQICLILMDLIKICQYVKHAKNS